MIFDLWSRVCVLCRSSSDSVTFPNGIKKPNLCFWRLLEHQSSFSAEASDILNLHWALGWRVHYLTTEPAAAWRPWSVCVKLHPGGKATLPRTNRLFKSQGLTLFLPPAILFTSTWQTSSPLQTNTRLTLTESRLIVVWLFTSWSSPLKHKHTWLVELGCLQRLGLNRRLVRLRGGSYPNF